MWPNPITSLISFVSGKGVAKAAFSGSKVGAGAAAVEEKAPELDVSEKVNLSEEATSQTQTTQDTTQSQNPGVLRRFSNWVSSAVGSLIDSAANSLKGLSEPEQKEVKQEAANTATALTDKTVSKEVRHAKADQTADSLAAKGVLSPAQLASFRSLSLKEKGVFLSRLGGNVESSGTPRELLVSRKTYDGYYSACSAGEKKAPEILAVNSRVVLSTNNKAVTFTAQINVRIAAPNVNQATVTQSEQDTGDLAEVVTMNDKAVKEAGDPPDLLTSLNAAKNAVSATARNIIEVADAKGFTLTNRDKLVAIADGSYYEQVAKPVKASTESVAAAPTSAPSLRGADLGEALTVGDGSVRRPKDDSGEKVNELLLAKQKAQAVDDDITKKLIDRRIQIERNLARKHASVNQSSVKPEDKQKGIKVEINTENINYVRP